MLPCRQPARSTSARSASLKYVRQEVRMNVRECYEAIDGDYEEVKRRFLTDARIRRFALLFLRDSSMEELRAAMRDQDCEKAFQAAHTLKGVCLNLGFSGLYKPVNIITELLRAGMYEKALDQMKEVEEGYLIAEKGRKKLEQS